MWPQPCDWWLPAAQSLTPSSLCAVPVLVQPASSSPASSPVQHADKPVDCPAAIRSPGRQKLDAQTAREAPSCPQPSASTYVPVLIYVRLLLAILWGT